MMIITYSRIYSFDPLKRNGSAVVIQPYIDELVQERHNSSALAMELRLSCANPSIYYQQTPIRYSVLCGCVYGY